MSADEEFLAEAANPFAGAPLLQPSEEQMPDCNDILTFFLTASNQGDELKTERKIGPYQAR